MTDRERLPGRRDSTIVEFFHDNIHYTAGFSRFADGRLAEVFLNGGKLDSQTDVFARDCAIAASLALQSGCPADDLRAALTRTGAGGAAGALSVALDCIAEVAS
ncbi:TSCPD domain-containing protein [Methylobacterium thuringiense]|uniref:ribonucleoside-diphosphate reductase n=1 Tax=Methylobacterium thuringiense TaxID=1003091 RepID=A0ABQ4TIA0_9HYPH|nr:hypothetical protein [Methylobacterium thuringiense]GJE54549.1 hypothetical protein EKPJFOCH_1027 [Methylobacterium thuringiense]